LLIKSILLINSCWQHALGNIHTAILNGLKIYLNKKSSTYTWFINEGYHVYDVEIFLFDLKSAWNNLGILRNITKRYSIKNFQCIMFKK